MSSDFAATGDLDADGVTDFVYLWSRGGAGGQPFGLRVVYGTPTGEFSEGASVDVLAATVRVADLDLDGWDDILFYEIGDSVGPRVIWNDEGCFDLVAPIADGPSPALVRQLLGDPAPEILLSGGGGSVTVIENHGDRTFSTWGDLAAPIPIPAIADVSGDALPDYVFDAGFSVTVGVQQPGNVFEEVQFDVASGGDGARSLTGDLDGDGVDEVVSFRPDAVRTTRFDFTDPDNPLIDVVATPGPGPFSLDRFCAPPSGSALDVALAIKLDASGEHLWLGAANPDGTFDAVDAGMVPPTTISAEHELVVAPGQPPEHLYQLGGQGGASFAYPYDPASETFEIAYPPTVTGGGSGELVSADIDDDGLDDIISLGASAGIALSLQLSNGDGTFTVPEMIPTPFGVAGYPQTPRIGELDGDGRPDLVMTFQNPVPNIDGQIVTWLGDGTSLAFAGQISLEAGLIPKAPAIADVDGDGLSDLVIGQAQGDFAPLLLEIAFGNGDGTFQPLEEFETDIHTPSGQTPYVLYAAGELDGEVGDEIVVAGTDAAFSGQQVGAVAWNGAGFDEIDPIPVLFSEWPYTIPSLQSAEVYVHDIDGDGYNDVVFAALGLGWGAAYGDGGGGWLGTSSNYEFFGQTLMSGIQVADAAPGRLGLVLCAPEHFTSVVLGPDLTSRKAAFLSGRAPVFVRNTCTVGDFDGDGHVDVASSVSSYALAVALGIPG